MERDCFFLVQTFTHFSIAFFQNPIDFCLKRHNVILSRKMCGKWGIITSQKKNKEDKRCLLSISIKKISKVK